MSFKKNINQGFTLLEILLVIGIIAVLAGIVIVAINPSRQLATVRNTERQSDIKQIDNALNQYYIDHGYYPNTLLTSLTEICDTGILSTTTGSDVNCTGLVDLTMLVPTYLTAIPTDPRATSTAGYKVIKNTYGKIGVSATAELDQTITIGSVTNPWTCGDTFIDTRDSQSYATVLLGSQCWMQENINAGIMVTGANDQYYNAILAQTDNSIIEKYCYDNLESNCTTYGGLYQWDETMQYVTTPGAQGVCPVDWHVPTDDEYKILEMYLGMTQEQADSSDYPRGTTEGDELKDTGLCEGRSPCGTSGFKALLTGSFGGGYPFDGRLSEYGNIYTSSMSAILGDVPVFRFFNLNSSSLYRSGDWPGYGFSVRCLKN